MFCTYFTIQIRATLPPLLLNPQSYSARNRIQKSLPLFPKWGDIYDFESNGEDVAVLRGVLHHLDRPEAAIAHLAKQFKAVMILELNGYNPVMKLIEKT